MEESRITSISEDLAKARFRFAIESLNKVNMMKPAENYLFSPHSIYELLLMVYFATSGDTETKLRHTLHLEYPKSTLIHHYLAKREYQVHPEYENISAFEAAAGYNDASIQMMIDCWITNIKCLNVETLQNIFKDRFVAVDFRTYPAYINHCINNTLAEAGAGHISDPEKLAMIKENMEIILTNLLCLKTQEFETSAIYQSVSENEQRGRFKWMCKSFRYNAINMHICELPYKNNKTSLFVLLPGVCSLQYTDDKVFDKCTMVDHMNELLNRLSNEEDIRRHFRNWLLEYRTKEESPNFVVWPNFELEVELPIHQLLKILGVEKLVTSDAIDMSGFVAGDNQRLHLGSAVHRAHVRVTEENTVASAVTALYTGNEIARPSQRVLCNSDKPFVWLIYDHHRRNILFVGAFNKIDENDSYLKHEWRKSSYGFF